jgi:cell volume regulation protein A
MEYAPVLTFIGLLVFLAHLFVTLFERTKVPDVLYLTLIGVIIGPVLHIVSPLDLGKVGHVFTAIALVVILFEGGLELSFDSLRAALLTTVTMAILGYIVAFVFVSAVAYWLMGLPIMLVFYVAAVLAAPAPAVMIPLARQLPMASATKTMLTLEAPVGEALGIVVALGVLDSIQFESVQIGNLIGRLLASFTFAVVIGGTGGFIWSILLHRVRQLRFAIFTTPAFLLVLFGITEFLGFSGPVSALTFGIALANAGTQEIPWLARKYNITPLQHNEIERAFFGEIVFLIKTFFFVYLGLSLTLVDWWTVVVALALTSSLVIARIVAVRLSTRKDNTTREDALRLSVMIPKGTAAAVLAALPVQMALAGGENIQNVIYTVVVASVLGTATLLFLMAKTPLASLFGVAFAGYLEPAEAAPEDQRENGLPFPS